MFWALYIFLVESVVDYFDYCTSICGFVGGTQISATINIHFWKNIIHSCPLTLSVVVFNTQDNTFVNVIYLPNLEQLDV